CPAAIFGHCDPAGRDALNKTLGDRRAIAIYALVTRQPDLWAYLYDTPEVGDRWDLRMVQAMLHTVLDANGKPYLAGAPSGVRDADTVDAVKRFQADAGLDADGDPGSKTRKVLYGAYMDRLCTPDPPAQASRLLMQPSDFLGGAGAQAGDLPKMSLQSCGKFNPIVLLTSDEMGGEDTTDGASKTTRNADDAPNRRVIMFLFPKGTKVDSGQWPCPKVKESNDACTAQFWPDGDSWRKNGDALKLYKDTHDTMACRFYDRFARRSPCERAAPYAGTFDVPPQKPVVPEQPYDEDLRIASNDPSFIPGRAAPPPAGASEGWDAYAVVPSATPPPMTFDHGFLDDGNGNIDESKRRAPTGADYVALAKWRAKLIAAQQFRPDLFDATSAYQHFLSATGADWNFSYDRFVEQDASGKKVLGSVVSDVMAAASLLNNSRGITASTNRDTFTIERGATQVEQGSASYPYPVTENWQKAIGAHVIWVEADVVVTTDPTVTMDGSKTQRRLFAITMTIHAEDEYNFNPHMADIATGTPDSDNGRFEECGLGKEFRSKSTLKRKITFSEAISFVPVAGVTPTPSDAAISKVR
ncbi:MAG: peptidoglycan-binding protein, partial [Polyangiaceae bacterium]